MIKLNTLFLITIYTLTILLSNNIATSKKLKEKKLRFIKSLSLNRVNSTNHTEPQDAIKTHTYYIIDQKGYCLTYHYGGTSIFKQKCSRNSRFNFYVEHKEKIHSLRDVKEKWVKL